MMERRAAEVGRRLAAIGVLAAFVAFGCFAWADTGWFGERMPDTIRTGNARGDYFHDGDDAVHGVRAGGVFSARHHQGKGGRR